MQFNLTGKHLDISPAMREYVAAILNRLGDTYHAVISAQVTLKIEKHEKIAEATLHVANDNDIHGNARHEDMYKAIDQLEDKLGKQLLRLKEKNEER